jgi:DNA repair exonuclease SbcCD ATPase subunit
MAKDPLKSVDSIEPLLQERQKIEHWLHRLKTAADKTPRQVRDRVERDYKNRLDEVVAELHSYSGELAEALERHRTVRDGLAAQESDAAERLAEAELRHTVGEFDETRWSEEQAEITQSLAKIREELTSLDAEIARLDEVMGLLEASPQPVSEGAAETEAVTKLLGEVVSPPASQPADVAAGKPAAAEQTQPQKEPVEELEFLRSVTEDESQGPAPARASGKMRIIPEAFSEPQTGETRAEISPKGGVASNDGSKAAAKTLKCDECGTMNLPTEWYCERCGAELAAL